MASDDRLNSDGSARSQMSLTSQSGVAQARRELAKLVESVRSSANQNAIGSRPAGPYGHGHVMPGGHGAPRAAGVFGSGSALRDAGSAATIVPAAVNAAAPVAAVGVAARVPPPGDAAPAPQPSQQQTLAQMQQARLLHQQQKYQQQQKRQQERERQEELEEQMQQQQKLQPPTSPNPPSAHPPSAHPPSVQPPDRVFDRRLAQMERIRQHTAKDPQEHARSASVSGASSTAPPTPASDPSTEPLAEAQFGQAEPSKLPLRDDDKTAKGNANAGEAAQNHASREQAHRSRSSSEPGKQIQPSKLHPPRRLSQQPIIPEETLGDNQRGAQSRSHTEAGIDMEGLIRTYDPQGQVPLTSSNSADSSKERMDDLDGSSDARDGNSPQSGSVEFEEEGIDLDAVKSVVIDNKTSLSRASSVASLRALDSAQPAGTENNQPAYTAADGAAAPTHTGGQEKQQPGALDTGNAHASAVRSGGSGGDAHGGDSKVASEQKPRTATSESESGQDGDKDEHAHGQADNLFIKRPLSPTREASSVAKRSSVFGQLRPSDDPPLTSPQKPVSALSAMMDKKPSKANPFAQAYAAFSGKGDPTAVKLKIYLPFSKDPLKPLFISTKREASVEEVIGFTLFEYVNESRSPMLPEKTWAITNWSLRIAEDDGSIDDDFPAVDRNRKIQKFGHDHFAICSALPIDDPAPNPAVSRGPQKAQTAQPEDVQPASASDASSPSGGQPPGSSPAAASIFLKIHLYSTLEVKQTTTMQMPLNIPMSEVFDRICRKRKYDSKDYVLKMADVKTDVPLDKTLEQLAATEFCVLKRASGGAGDVFLRPPDEEDLSKSEKTDEKPFMTEDFRSVYKQYPVVYKHLMGRHDRNLTIDGEYIHLVAAETKAFFDRGKTTNSFHISSIVSCKQLKKKSINFKLIIRRNHDVKVYELDAASETEAGDICTRITAMLSMARGSAAVDETS
ncbi:stress-activated map kinase interacting protein 1-domain-containing protein [Entophlyctis helioformis]|nr:stress-activated map kinase interacting protein 1-domain-containing protein [Entophlyctis helioformis]